MLRHKWSLQKWPVLPRGSRKSYLSLTFMFTVFVLYLICIVPHKKKHTAMVSKLPPISPVNKVDSVFFPGCQDPIVNADAHPRANAAIVILARNSELPGVLHSMESLERHFNRWFNYPYVILNDQSFDSNFKRTVRKATKSTVEFGTIPGSDWNFPDWADKDEVTEAIRKQSDQAIMYGGLESYHKMCRFYSGKFYNHEKLAKYDWYWRVEPDVDFFCDLTYDPFVYMEQNNKTYGFNIFIKELAQTVPNLFRYTVGHRHRAGLDGKTPLWDLFTMPNGVPEIRNNVRVPSSSSQTTTTTAIGTDATRSPEYEAIRQYFDKAMHVKVEDENRISVNGPKNDKFYSEMEGETYNLCHFWSNFEIARLDFFRSEEYNAYFDMLDSQGGFWNERWGDAPVHSLAAGLFLKPNQLHYFRDIGYKHSTIQHCPVNAPGDKQLPHIPYFPQGENKEWLQKDEYWRQYDEPQAGGVGCRCRCDAETERRDVESSNDSCIAKWIELIDGWE